MHIRNKAASALWKFALVAFATYGLLDGAGILAGTYHTGFPHMFTNVSNIFAWGYFLAAAVRLAAGKDDKAGYTGVKRWSDHGKMVRLLKALDAHGLNIHVHTIGDGASGFMIDAIEEAQAATGNYDMRNAFAHLHVVDPADRAHRRQQHRGVRGPHVDKGVRQLLSAGARLPGR